MDFEKVGNINLADSININKCGCTCNGGQEHSGNTDTDNANFNGSRITEDFSS